MIDLIQMWTYKEKQNPFVIKKSALKKKNQPNDNPQQEDAIKAGVHRRVLGEGDFVIDEEAFSSAPLEDDDGIIEISDTESEEEKRAEYGLDKPSILKAHAISEPEELKIDDKEIKEVLSSGLMLSRTGVGIISSNLQFFEEKVMHNLFTS